VVFRNWPLSIRVATCAALLLRPGIAAERAVTILVYHRFGPVRTDSMTVTTEHFRQQLDLLCKNNYTIIPLSKFLCWRLGNGSPPPPNAIVLTFDDGHVSQYREAQPVILGRRLPVTLFIYPSCISNASYAMTWGQVREIAASGLFDIQSHTFWHPNFKHEAKRLNEPNYKLFVDNQLGRSKAVLENEVQRRITMLAWPFGIHDPFLEDRAAALGYEAAFSIECRSATGSDSLMSLPRCLVSDEYVGPRFLSFIRGAEESVK
jgi:peptidoglycan/xylan/chitin deacetylase (PgdA/CDA1 family)